MVADPFFENLQCANRAYDRGCCSLGGGGFGFCFRGGGGNKHTVDNMLMARSCLHFFIASATEALSY